jgi:hypothetical protein
MSTTNAAPATAQTTEEVSGAAKIVPNRSAVLSAFAKEAMGEAEPAAPDAGAAGNNADEALSQQNAEAEAGAETAEEKAAREAAEAEAAAGEQVENHLEDDLRQELPEAVQDKINRRIGKEVAKTKAEREAREALEARAAELEAQLAAAPKGETRAGTTVPLGDVHDAGKLAGKKVEAEQALEQSEDLLSVLDDDPASVEEALRAAKVDLKDADGEDDYTPARMRRWLRAVQQNANRMLRTHIPNRETFLKTAETAAQRAVEFMPELKDTKSERGKLFQQVLREHPEIQARPDWPLRVMAGVKALEWLAEQIKARTTPAPKTPREKPVSIPAPKAQPPRVVTKPTDTVDANAMTDAVLSGDKSARLKFLTGLVPVR